MREAGQEPRPGGVIPRSTERGFEQPDQVAVDLEEFGGRHGLQRQVDDRVALPGEPGQLHGERVGYAGPPVRRHPNGVPAGRRQGRVNSSSSSSLSGRNLSSRPRPSGSRVVATTAVMLTGNRLASMLNVARAG